MQESFAGAPIIENDMVQKVQNTKVASPKVAFDSHRNSLCMYGFPKNHEIQKHMVSSQYVHNLLHTSFLKVLSRFAGDCLTYQLKQQKGSTSKESKGKKRLISVPCHGWTFQENKEIMRARKLGKPRFQTPFFWLNCSAINTSTMVTFFCENSQILRDGTIGSKRF